MGIRPREILAGCPQLSPYEFTYFVAFGDLATERQMVSGMSVFPGPIPVSAIHAYADRHELSRLQADLLYLTIKAMDSAWLAAVASKREKASATNK